MDKYVLVLLEGDYGDYLDTVQVEADSVEEAKKKGLALAPHSDAAVEAVIKGELMQKGGD